MRRQVCTIMVRDTIFEILLIVRNILIINTNWNDKMTKETN